MGKKNTYSNGPALPHQPREPKMDAAGFLATVARRFVNGNANTADVEAAIKVWRESLASVELPDGIYRKFSTPRIGTIADHALEAVCAASDIGEDVWLVFNGSSVRVSAGDDAADVVRRWLAHREAYQAGK